MLQYLDFDVLLSNVIIITFRNPEYSYEMNTLFSINLVYIRYFTTSCVKGREEWKELFGEERHGKTI